MQKKPVSLIRNLGPVVIYLDNLRVIAELLQTENGSVKITLKDKNQEYEFVGPEGVDEISSLPVSCFHNVEIESSGDVYFQLELREALARIYVSGGTAKGRGIIEKCHDILRPRNKLISAALFNPVLPMFAAIYGFGSIIVNNYIFSMAILALAAVWLYAGYVTSCKRFCTLHTKPRIEMPSFFIRRKDDILLAAISGLLGAVLGALATYAIGR